MPEFLIIVTAFVILLAMYCAFHVTRDPLHPMIFLAPMLFYMFVMRPVVLMHAGVLERMFTPPQILFVLTIKLLTNIFFCAGCLWGVWHFRGAPRLPAGGGLSAGGRQWAFVLGCFFGFVSLAAYLIMLFRAGGPMVAYSVPYAGAGWAPSGYILEAPQFSLPALVLLAISRQGRILRIQDLALILLFGSPWLIQGLLGARRGALFFSAITLWMAWHVYTNRRPSLWKTLTGVTILGLLALAVVTYRKEIYIGSKLQIDPHQYIEAVLNPVDAGAGDDFIDSSGILLTSSTYGRHNWGLRCLATYFVRPIPRQLWPNKYVDIGMGWMDSPIDRFGYTDVEWENAAGFNPIYGMSLGLDGSFFLDFSWFGLIGCWLAGFFFAYVWRKERQHQGVWQILSVACLAFSVFAPAQDFYTFLYRWLFVCLPACVAWAIFIRPRISGKSAAGAKTGRPSAETPSDDPWLEDHPDLGILPRRNPLALRWRRTPYRL